MDLIKTYYKVEEKDLKKLLRDSMELNALECAGVDNWNFYGDHWEEYFVDSEGDIDDLLDLEVKVSMNRYKRVDCYSEMVAEDILAVAIAYDIELNRNQVQTISEQVYDYDYSDYNEYILERIREVI